MNFTTLISGTTASSNDDAVMKAIESESADIKAVKLQRMKIGIRNENGGIYRAIGVTGLTEFLDVIQKLLDLNYVDELKDNSGTVDGYDAIFSRN